VHRPRTDTLSGSSEAVRLRPTVGVIDIGSNTARLVVFETTTAGTVRAVYEGKESPRLGLDVGPDGSLSEAAIARGVETARRFRRALKSVGSPEVVAVATSAVRDAPNGVEFLREVERAAGVSLRILTGQEEARYAYLGVASTWELHHDLIADLGGGSLQLAEVRGGALRHTVSLPLGALRLSQRFFDHDPPKRREWEALREYVRETVDSAVDALRDRCERLVGVGGTVRSLARATIELRRFPIRRVHGYLLTDHDIEALHELLAEMPAEKRRAVPGVGGDRADVVLAGIVVLEELARSVESDRWWVSGVGIREGLALEAVGAKLPATAEELVDRSVTAAAQSFSFNLAHGREVTECALALFDLLAPRFGWGRSERRIVQASAGLHDAGIAVDLWNHARHSAYLVRNFPIWGLDQREVVLAGMAVYLHEGDDPPSEWKKGYLPLVGPAELDTAVRLGAILAVAERVSAARPRFALAAGGRAVALNFSAGALSALPSRWSEKVRRPMERGLGVELKVRDA
jgi:exopolyphosphatase / guanosine-5'-triphosphate,3'-diphosphate pyrophosphatase